MCGSVAVLAPEGATESAVRAALKLLESRGPDGSGILINGAGALGHCRLSLRDAAGGVQPLKLADGRTLAFVGEIYNDETLRQVLRLSGYVPVDNSDTDILASAISLWGNAAWEKLDGMFAVMLLSKDGHTLELIRDRFGVKSIFFSADDNGVVAASEPVAIVDHARPLAASRSALIHFLSTSQVSWCGQTVWQNVQTVACGSQSSIDLHGAKSTRWASAHCQATGDATAGSNPAKLTYLLGEAVYRQSRADFPVGVFLSGGLDSSLLAALYARQQSAPIRTYAVSMAGDTEDLEFARLTAEHIGSDHEELVVTPESFFSGMRDLTVKRGLPVSLPNEVLIFRLSQVAQHEIKAVLSGEGADELFGGYYRLSSRLRVRRDMIDPMPRAYRAATTWFSSHDLQFTLREPERLWHVRDYDEANLQAMLDTSDRSDDLRTLLLSDHFPHLLLRLDGATMAASLEGRVPFTDPDVVKFALSLNANDLEPQFGLEKSILRAAGLGVLPEVILRRPKRAFNASLAQLFASSEGQATLISAISQPLIAELFDQEKLEQLLNEDSRNQVYHRTWLVCSLGLWSELCRVNEIC